MPVSHDINSAKSNQRTVFSSALEQVLKVYPGPDGMKAPQYKAFYDEIVTRCVADTAGILQSSRQETKNHPLASRFQGLPPHPDKLSVSNEHRFDSRPGSELEAMYKVLASQKGEQAARNMILGNLPSFTKGIVYTPHPTELLGEAAIEAQERLMMGLLKCPELFSGRAPYISNEKRNSLHNALKNLSETITVPVTKQLTIDEEMRRSVRFSQREFDSIPGIADTILTATHSPASSQLTLAQLGQFGHLLSPETWSPGDQDSKPDMTVDKLQKGISLGERAIMFHYYRTLTALGANIADSNSTEGKAAEDAINNIMHRLLKTGCASYDSPKTVTQELATEKLNGQPEAMRGNAERNFSTRYSALADSDFFRKFCTQGAFEKKAAAAKPYANADELLHDLANLRERAPIRDVHDEKRRSLNVVDSLIIQVMNFRDSALRIQVRQNAEMHAKVLDTILEKLPNGTIPTDIKAKLHSEDDATAIETLLTRFKDDPTFRQAVQKVVSQDLQQTAQKLATLPTEDSPEFASRKAHTIQDIGDKHYELYQTMETMGLAASKPDRVPRYLIAECRSKTDILEAFFLLKVMESLRAPNAKNKVEIVNLVEHPDRVKGEGNGIAAVSMTVGAMNNEQFRSHHLSIPSSQHLLEGYSLADGKHPLTVAEVKGSYGIPIEDGDSTRRIAGVKMMMGAGSDVTKAGGCAAAAAMMDAVDSARKGLLNNEPPILLVDYLGCGGGLHRTQPTRTSFETVQGQSMRQSPENVAQKVLTILTDHERRVIALDPLATKAAQHDKPLAKIVSPEERKLQARVNLSNMAGFPTNDAMWQSQTRPRTYAMMEKYDTLYTSPEFEQLMSYSANMFGDMTKFAARPSDRVGAPKKEKGFLAPVSVAETRAIGFGAALNAAGIYAPMFFGGSDYLNTTNPEDEKQLRTMYLWDPKAQDTINRMTYGVIMADMDVAWKYLGRKHPPSEAELKSLANSPSPSEESASLTREQKHAMAEKCLAQIHLEYNTVAGKLLRLHQAVEGKPRLSETTDGAQASEQLLGTLPLALREQLSFSRQHIKVPREALADLFHQMVHGDIDPKTVDKNSDTYKNVIYPAMGAIFECTEHAARAYTRPKWVKATELQQQQRS